MEVNVHVALSLYAVAAAAAGIETLLLPIETKGRAMTVRRQYSQLSTGPFCATRSNPTHQLTDPTQSNPNQPNLTHGSTQPMDNLDSSHE